MNDEWFHEVSEQSEDRRSSEDSSVELEVVDQSRRVRARRRFRGVVYCIIMIQHFKSKLPIRVERAKYDPYVIRPLRVFIDNAAFRIVFLLFGVT